MKYAAGLRTKRLQVVADAMNEGDGSAKLQILDDSGAVLLTHDLPLPIASVVGDVLSLLGTPFEMTATGDGSPEKGRILNSLGEVIVDEFTVGSGGDWEIDVNTLKPNQTVRLVSALIIHS